jgi:type I restriction enzyme S subunit
VKKCLASGWRRLTVEQLAAPACRAIVSGPFGSNIGKRFFVESGVPLIRGNNLTLGDKKFVDDGFVFITEEKAHELRNCEALPDDLVFTAAGTLGQVGLIPKSGRFQRYIISNKQLRLRCNTEIADPTFLYYWFAAPDMREHIANQNTGASIPLITLGTLRHLEVWVPPVPIQRRIASVLSAYDDLIENNRRRIKILEEMAQAIYREWFVHFRFPGHKKVKLVNSPLGPIPEGWSVRKLGEVVELAYGKALKAENRRKGNIPVYGSSGIVGFHDESLVGGPGIIVGRKGNVGTVHWCGGDFFPIDTVFYVQTNIPLRYTYYNLQTQNFISGDAAVPGLSRTQAYSLPILVPAENVLTKFEGLVEGFFAATRNLQERNKKLRETRDLVLPKLISGEVDVSRLDIQGDEAI